MFARSGPRMGMRFASGNVFYMNRMYTSHHLRSVASPLTTGFISPVRFMGTTPMSTVMLCGLTVDCGLVDINAITVGTAFEVLPPTLACGVSPAGFPPVRHGKSMVSMKSQAEPWELRTELLLAS